MVQAGASRHSITRLYGIFGVPRGFGTVRLGELKFGLVRVKEFQIKEGVLYQVEI